MSTVAVAVYSLIGIIIFAVINLYSNKIARYISKHKILILSFFGGVTASYVFLDLLPSLQYSNLFLKQLAGNIPLVELYEDTIFLVVLIGFLLFFVLEHLAFKSRRSQQETSKVPLQQTQASKRVFLIHLFTVALPIFVVSFVFVFEFETGYIAATLFAVAVSMHLFISSEAMFEHYKNYQIRFGRYILAVVPFVGWIASLLIPETVAQAYVLLAFISGVILYHSIRNELPTSLRRGSSAFFLTGALLYAVLLIGHALINA